MPSWLSGYARRAAISIPSSSDGELTNYQLKFSIIKGGGSNSGSTIYLGGVAYNWPYDIRFTSSDGETLIDFWREESDATDGTWWVEVPTVPASGGTTIYIYYGRSGATDASDMASTFIDSDGFEYSDALTNHGWSIISNATDIITSTTNAKSGTRSARATGDAEVIGKTPSSSSNRAVEFNFYDTGDDIMSATWIDGGTKNIITGINPGQSETYYITREGANWYVTAISRSTGWHKIRVEILSTGSKVYIDNTLVRSPATNTTLDRIYFGSTEPGTSTDYVYWDDLVVMNFTANPPSPSAGSFERLGGGGAIMF